MTAVTHDLAHDAIRAVDWSNGAVKLLDQRVLPQREEYLILEEAPALANAIRMMAVRGAPAIGIAAAYGVVLAARLAYRRAKNDWRSAIEVDIERLRAARPTAVNLHWALQRMQEKFVEVKNDPEPILLAEAKRIHDEDITANKRMGALGAELIHGKTDVLTHCNTGSLATGGFGTALGVIRSAYARGVIQSIYACETRPWLQGARLTAWELMRDKIPVTVIADSAAAHLMQQRCVRWVIVGADRIARNGDLANKIGTYSLALSARAHDLKFMTVAPTSSLDMSAATGADIPIEDRPSGELLELEGHRLAAEGALAWNPVFDVTPARLIDFLVTEKGVVPAPDAAKLAALMQDAHS
ncbi:MAG: S-methyl-5-thioribose-1-phosphate isomerase [Gammaproteobacteria bacterium]|nr:S-methyl-5-thioribose-1-phosphate isomerase [Gammaproteobacteria bacterium]MCI0590404.1 S-methyl-5-thioribose-1-phosphate isomerase [Gammaproteobacteria bacterium]